MILCLLSSLLPVSKLPTIQDYAYNLVEQLWMQGLILKTWYSRHETHSSKVSRIESWVSRIETWVTVNLLLSGNVYLTDVRLAAIWGEKGWLFCCSVSPFLQLVVACTQRHYVSSFVPPYFGFTSRFAKDFVLILRENLQTLGLYYNPHWDGGPLIQQ